jgi:3-keto-5-aminohexanoate cleavage enzyme
MEPVVVAVAITGSVPARRIIRRSRLRLPSRSRAPNKPMRLVRRWRISTLYDGIRRHCPGMIVQFSTGGRGRDPSQRSSSLFLKPDMASLATGSVNFPSIVYENHTALVEDLASKMKDNGIKPEIEVFDLSHLHGARRLTDRGLLDERPHMQFVMGIQNAMPAHEHLLDVLLTEAKRLFTEAKRLFPACTWTAAGIGRHQAEVMGWAVCTENLKSARNGDEVHRGLGVI